MANLIECPNPSCSHQVSDEAQNCPYCNFEVASYLYTQKYGPLEVRIECPICGYKTPPDHWCKICHYPIDCPVCHVIPSNYSKPCVNCGHSIPSHISEMNRLRLQRSAGESWESQVSRYNYPD